MGVALGIVGLLWTDVVGAQTLAPGRPQAEHKAGPHLDFRSKKGNTLGAGAVKVLPAPQAGAGYWIALSGFFQRFPP